VSINQKNKPNSLLSFLLYLKNTERLKDDAMTAKALRSLKKHLDGKDPDFEDLTEPVIKSWIDALLPKLALATIVRYVESLSQLNKHAIRLEYIEKNEIFYHIREYIDGLSDGGFDRISQQYIDIIQKLARVHRTDPPKVGYAIDVYLYSFYHAGLDIDKVIEMQDDSLLCQLPQTDALKLKYYQPHRKYIFPLEQWKRTAKQVKLSIERDFQSYLNNKGFKIGSRSNEDFITRAWVAAAKSCGISNADICACCPQVMAKPKLKGVQPSDLTQPQIDDIKRQVANSIVDMVPHWYAIRFVGKDTVVSDYIKDICETEPYKIFYPIDEIYKKVKKRRVVESRPTIRNIMFIQTAASTISKIESAKIDPRTFHVIRNQARQNKSFAIIPNSEMRTFSMLVSNGLDILDEEDLQKVEILTGSYVEITDGPNKGYRGNVYKIRNKDNSKATVLEIQVPELSNLGNFLITVRPEFVKCLKELPADTPK
jgi:transcription antitermination factor NusG